MPDKDSVLRELVARRDELATQIALMKRYVGKPQDISLWRPLGYETVTPATLAKAEANLRAIKTSIIERSAQPGSTNLN